LALSPGKRVGNVETPALSPEKRVRNVEIPALSPGERVDRVRRFHQPARAG